MQTSLWQRTKLPKLHQITYLWLNELHAFFPTWNRTKLEPLAHQTLKDFYLFVDNPTQNHRLSPDTLFDPKVIPDQSALFDIVHVFIALRTALRQSLVNCDSAETLMIMEHLDVWQQKVVSSYTTSAKQYNQSHPAPFERQLEQLKKLNDCVCALNSTLDTVSLLHATAQLAHALTDADLCIVFQKEGKILFSKASAGHIGYDSKPVKITTPVQLETMIIDEYRQDVPLDFVRGNLGIDKTFAMICTNIQTDTTILGKLTSVYSEPQRFTPQQVRLQEIFSQQAAQAICNAQLYETLGDRKTTHERQRIAREMHDTMFQSLVSLNIKLKVALKRAEHEDWEQVKDLIEDARHLGKTAIVKGRETLNNLHEDCSVCEPMLDLLKSELDLFAEQSGITPNLIVLGNDSSRAPKALGHHVQRLVGEALSNIFRHARATEVTVRIELVNNKLNIEIQDNGIGFELRSVDERHSFGLIGMRGRANLIDAELRIYSTPGQGTLVIIQAPLRCQNAVSSEST